MFKISKGSIADTYKLESYVYIKETNFHVFLFSIDNKPWDTLEQVLQGRIANVDELTWAHDIVRLTNCDAVIDDLGQLQAVPVKRKEAEDGRVNREGTREASREARLDS